MVAAKHCLRLVLHAGARTHSRQRPHTGRGACQRSDRSVPSRGLLRGFEGLAALLSASTLPGVNDAGLVGGAPRTWAVVGGATVQRRAGVRGTRLDAVAGRSLVVPGDVASLTQAVRVLVNGRCPVGQWLHGCCKEGQVGPLGSGLGIR